MCIVAVHVFEPVTVSVHGVERHLDAVPEFAGFWKLVRGFLQENGVATFFFISGYLFFAGGEMTSERYRRKLRSRVGSLFVPYVLWNAIAVLFLCVLALPVFRRFLPDFDLANFIPSASGLASGFVMNSLEGYPHDSPMWFIRELMLCVLTVPLVKLLPERVRGWFVAVLGALCCLFFVGGSGWPQLLTSALFFFYFGGWLGMRGHDLLVFFRRFRTAALILYPLLSVLFMALSDGPYATLAMFVKWCDLMVVIALAVNLAGWLVHRHDVRANRFLNGATFFVFAAHFIGLDYYRKILMTVFHPATGLGTVLTFVAGYFLLLGWLLVLYWLLTRFAPAVARVLTGKRASAQSSPDSPAPKSAKS